MFILTPKVGYLVGDDIYVMFMLKPGRLLGSSRGGGSGEDTGKSS